MSQKLSVHQVVTRCCVTTSIWGVDDSHIIIIEGEKNQWTTEAVGCYPIPSLKTAGGKKTFNKIKKNSRNLLTRADI